MVIIDLTDVLVIDSKNRLSRFVNVNSIPDAEYFLSKINWMSIKKSYKGISFTPYHREWAYMSDSVDTMWWYSAVDCDSACIWDKSAIVSLGKPEHVSLNSEFSRLEKEVSLE